jgi:hypothetical protein
MSDREQPRDRALGDGAVGVVDGQERRGERLGGQIGGKLRLGDALGVKRQHRIAVTAVEDVKAAPALAACLQQLGVVAVASQSPHISIAAAAHDFVTEALRRRRSLPRSR